MQGLPEVQVRVKHDALMHRGQSKGSQKTKKNVNREEFIDFAEIRGMCNLHHWPMGQCNAQLNAQFCSYTLYVQN